MSRGYFQHGGVTFPGLLYSPRGLEAAREFPVEDDDVFNVTYQKSGTVWMLEILSLIRQGGDPRWCRSVPNWERGPWLETLLAAEGARQTPGPRIISSHLPVHLFPKKFFGSKAKVIYTVRDPKDVPRVPFPLCSDFPPYKDPGSLEEFMEKFLQGDVPFGSWFQHVRGVAAAPGRENFFWISYEELQQDLRGSVQRLCSFLGRPLSGPALDAVVANASFVTMSHNPMSNFSLAPAFILDRRRGPFLRKGISGDWRNHLTPEQSRRFDLVYRERMEGLGVSFPWDPPESPPKSPQSLQEPQKGEESTQKGEDSTQKYTQDTPKTTQDPQKEEESPQKGEEFPQKMTQDPQKRGGIPQKYTQDTQKTLREPQKEEESPQKGEEFPKK
ncbi:LOW QUALITY PROTEIN: sulfotransferase 2B1-like [Agelaius phoeniceus]|uniref:LOW QUALITY PROTEIN: sulfotransferase 2B1-like n=1 Tax=Agelaius phoeniceus TaxID=39638 RepID=UPI004054EB71